MTVAVANALVVLVVVFPPSLGCPGRSRRVRTISLIHPKLKRAARSIQPLIIPQKAAASWISVVYAQFLVSNPVHLSLKYAVAGRGYKLRTSEARRSWSQSGRPTSCSSTEARESDPGTSSLATLELGYATVVGAVSRGN